MQNNDKSTCKNESNNQTRKTDTSLKMSVSHWSIIQHRQAPIDETVFIVCILSLWELIIMLSFSEAVRTVCKSF